MKIQDLVSDELYEYALSVRRHLHRYPEVGFDLPKTASFVKNELSKMGVPYLEDYAPCSVVAWIGTDKQKATIAFRADMDALPVQEETDLPFKSEHEGYMHACGHDAHTAILLSVVKALKEQEKCLPCNVRFLFQPSEEGEQSGARMMTENNALDGVDAIIGAHCDGSLKTGTIGICPGDCMAACVPVNISFHGKTAHATMPEDGVDAIAMAVEACSSLKEMVCKEAGEADKYIWSVGSIHGGEVHNVIADHCALKISFRYYNEAFAERVLNRAEQICKEIAKKRGGSVTVNWHVSTSSLYNDPRITASFAETVAALEDPQVITIPSRLSSEDFSWYLCKVPGVFFRFGIGSDQVGYAGKLHSNHFMMDEEGMKAAIAAFIRMAFACPAALK